MSASFLGPAKAGLIKQIWHKSAPLTLSTILLGACPTNAALRDLTVISSTDTEFHFVVQFGGMPASLEQLVGADSLLYLSRPVQIGIPIGAQPRIEFAQGSDLTTFDKGFLNDTNRGRQLANLSLAKLSRVWSMRGRQFVTVLISPIVGENIYKGVDIKVVFEGASVESGTTKNDPKFNRILATSIANWDECKNWSPIQMVASKVSAQPGPFSVTADWYKVAVNRNGIQSVTFNDLKAAGLIGNSISSQTIYMYNGGGLPVSPKLTDPRPVFQQIAISVEDGNDGNFESGDRVLFYGESVNRWLYDSAGASFVNNIYTDKNIYWLAISNSILDTPLRISSINAAPTGTAIDTFNTYTNYVRQEQENILRRFNDGQFDDYFHWYWTTGESLTVFVPAVNVVPGQTSNIFLSARTFDTTGALDAVGYVDLSVNGQPGLSKNCDLTSCTYQTSSLVSGMNSFSMQLWGSVIAAPYFDYLELSYKRSTVPIGGSLDASFGSYSGVVRVDITDNFSTAPLLYNIDNPAQPARLTGATRQSGMVSFEANFNLNSPNRFFATGPSSLISPVSITRVTPVDLYSSASQADLIIVTTAALAPALTEYINYRSAAGISIKTVTVNDVMDNFGFGLHDPSAIRDFLKHAYENYPSPAPSAVLFVGDANYDFLDRLGTGVPNLVPPYLFEFDKTLSDDNYVYFGDYGVLDSDTSYVGGDRGFDMMSARWPVSSAAEINSLVAKLKLYESPTTFDSWRTEITLVADDEFGTFNNETFHTIQTEDLGNNHVPAFLNKEKIYLWDYPFVNREKPAVNDAIVNAINKGTLLVNYVGHGSPDVWAHEHVFSRTGDLPRLTNTNRLPLVFTASCAIGFFDDPKREGMAEDLIVMNGGAIAVISATRLVFSSDNAAFNRQVYDVLLNDSLYSDSLTMCEATYAAKLLRQYAAANPPAPVTNDRNYMYFGDPYLKLGVPRLNVSLDSTLDSLKALLPVRVTGRVTNDFGAQYNSDGRLVISVFDSERDKTYRLLNAGGQVIQTINYSVTGPTIYRGSATISNGIFDFTFIPPLDIGYGGSGAKISLYAVLDTIDAAGVMDSIAVATTVATSTDSVGPNIGITFSGKPLQAGGNVIKSGERLDIALADSSGINLTGGLGHGITLQIDGNAASLINLTGLFQYNQDDYTSGAINYDLDSLEAGLHAFKFKAWDNANNSSTLEFTAEIVTSSALAIQDLLNYPNPMSEKTSFSFSLTQSVEKFSLEIYTLSGRKINSFDRLALAPAYYNDIVWDGRDAYGDRVATGVYLYKATAVSTVGNTVEEFGKVVLINQ